MQAIVVQCCLWLEKEKNRDSIALWRDRKLKIVTVTPKSVQLTPTDPLSIIPRRVQPRVPRKNVQALPRKKVLPNEVLLSINHPETRVLLKVNKEVLELKVSVCSSVCTMYM